MPEITIADDPLPRGRVSVDDLHYRLFLGFGEAGPIVIAMQHCTTDYAELDQTRLLDPDQYDDEADALRALNTMLTARVNAADFADAARAAAILAHAGAPLTRAQAIDAALARGLAAVEQAPTEG